ncbi:MAG TPA: VTT domain-containing protein [Candidatus Saccharimonadales bacterium]|nr:VTT domain-containing protein [Candidatus Saccharimonadales bacterium]
MLNPTQLIQSGGLLLIGLLIFAESGMMLGFFLPGDTLILSAGLFAAQGKLNLPALLVVVILAAICGDNVGYTIGRTAGRKLFRKPNGLFFRQKYLTQSEKFYERYGPKAMLLAHFLPIVRTFAPVAAGIGKMKRLQFVIFDGIGDAAWGALLIMLGYWFGSKLPKNIDNYILPLVIVVVVLSFGPMFWHIFKSLQERKHPNDQPKKKG